MLFSSFVFLSIFLPVLLAVYYFSGREHRNTILLIFSLLFYGWGEPVLLSVMILSIIWNYTIAVILDRFSQSRCRKLILGIGIAANLLCLGYFKYMDFFIENINWLFNTNTALLHVIMPIGISFYTFQSISYLVDVYRNDVKVEKNILNVGLYITFFPQLIAGPIVKFHEISHDITLRQESLSNFSSGMQRFIEGLAKKVLIANVMAAVADSVFQRGIPELTGADLWLGATAYFFQIFFDFSGYSDMAIGLGKMFGFRIPENFNFPYVSKTITEFWRRWHISLSTWFKEYLYIPLGGSRCSWIKVLRNLLIVFAVTGIWHGASWTFLAWGLWHGFFIILERITGLNKKVFHPAAAVVMRIYLLSVVFIGWIFFRADNFQYSFAYIRKMFSFENWKEPTVAISPLFIVILCAAVFFSTELPHKIYTKFKNSVVFTVFWKALCVILLLLVLIRLASSSYNPFIYFRF